MQKQQTIPTALGQLTVSSLTLGELRQLDSLFTGTNDAPAGISSLFRYLPVIFSSLRKVHQDLSQEQLENGLTLEDFSALFGAVLEVSGLKKAAAGEPTPVATATGWTFREIDALTLWDVSDLFDYWQECPPTHVLVAAYLIGDRKRPRGKGKLAAAIGDLTTAVQLAGGGMRGKLPGSYRIDEIGGA